MTIMEMMFVGLALSSAFVSFYWIYKMATTDYLTNNHSKK